MIVAHWKRGAELNNGHSQATSLAFLQPRTGCGKPSELWRMVLPRSVRLHQLRFFWLTWIRCCGSSVCRAPSRACGRLRSLVFTSKVGRARRQVYGRLGDRSMHRFVEAWFVGLPATLTAV